MFFFWPLCCLSFDLWVLITWYLQTLLVLVGIFKKKKSIHFSPSNQRRDELTIHYAIICVILTKHTCSRLNGYHTTSHIVTAVIRFDTYFLMNFQNHIFLSYNWCFIAWVIKKDFLNCSCCSILNFLCSTLQILVFPIWSLSICHYAVCP